MNKQLAILDETITEKIYIIRGKRVMIDRDLAELYGVETRTLNQAVKRNNERFPADFMFEMTEQELQNWRSQFVISNSAKMGLRYKPFCFTELGVAMLSSILNSKQAIAVNIQIMRVFSRMRELLLTHKDILLKLEQLEKKLMKHDDRMSKYDEEMQVIFSCLKQLMNPPQPPRRKIGFKLKNEE